VPATVRKIEKVYILNKSKTFWQRFHQEILMLVHESSNYQLSFVLFLQAQ